MALSTFSAFYYGHEVTVNNNLIDINEGAGNLIATIPVGNYSLTDYVDAVETALNDAGTLTYTVTVNRSTRIITISATGTFSILFSSGPSASVSAYELLGFAASDFTAATSYVATQGSGSEYRPQFLLQDYVDSNDNLELFDAVVNKAANGRVQVITFGEERFFEMTMKFITNIPMDDIVILNNPTGVADARSFFEYAISKVPLEFMPDIGTRATYTKVILESTEASKNGTGYKLKEMVSSNLPGLYEASKLKFRVLTS